MYGELIRIQMMLAKDDPQMQVIHFTVLCHTSPVSIFIFLNIAEIFHPHISFDFYYANSIMRAGGPLKKLLFTSTS